MRTEPTKKDDDAASEVIGTVLLISIVVLASSIVAVAVFSHPQAQKIPALSALISNQSQIVYIKHNGGESLANGTYKILVDGTDVTSSVNKTGSPTAWSIGDLITYTKPGTTPPSSVQIVFTGAGSPVVIAASYFGSLSPMGSITPTQTGTPVIYYNITASASAGGSISPSGSVSVISGGSQMFTISPNTGYAVANVLVDGSSVGSVLSYTFTGVTASHNISASFTTASNTIAATAGSGGSISPSGSVNVNYGGNQTFTISPSTGYSITSVVVDGSSIGSVSSYTFSNVTSSHTISASFAINIESITASAGSGGSISPSGIVNVSYGGSQTFNITPNIGYSIASVLVDGSSVGNNATYQFTNVTIAHTIAASFTLTTVAITSSAGSGGSISPLGSINVNYGSNQTYTITPNAGYSITNVLVDGSSVGSVGSYTFTNVISPHTIAAYFTVMPVYKSLSPTAGPIAGGTSVIILGSGFTNATSVSFGGTPSSFTFNSDSQITAITPAHSTGPVSVSITTPGGTTTGINAYTYSAIPVVSGVSPATGISTGGTTVIITGSGFTGVTGVKFGSAIASFTFNSDSQITVSSSPASSPAGSAGIVDITVTTPGGTSAISSSDHYDYFVIQQFTSVGTSISTVPSGAASVQYLVVGGGGGGGGLGGGGGAGGFVTGTLTGLSGSYSVTVGGGGTGGTTAQGTSGGNSIFGSISATGGGGGGTSSSTASVRNGGSGGSGGGGSRSGSTGGTGISGQGSTGGTGNSNGSHYLGGGGGGSSAVGSAATTTVAGSGGAGTALPITGATGVPASYSGGGGGGCYSSYAAGTGGSGGGGNGSNSGAGGAGTANTGGGGGGSSLTTASGGAGGSGIVILKYY